MGLKELQDLQFQLNGGWPAVFFGFLGLMARWVVIGMCFKFGYNLF